MKEEIYTSSSTREYIPLGVREREIEGEQV